MSFYVSLRSNCEYPETLILTSRKKNVEKAVENPEISTAKYYDVQN
jgi:hypothetical protein